MHDGPNVDLVNSILKRHLELFGSIATERAGIRLMRSNDNMSIIKCRLDQVESVLATIALIDIQVLTLGTSGSIKQLKEIESNISRNLNPQSLH